jgi:hypothetical protein
LVAYKTPANELVKDVEKAKRWFMMNKIIAPETLEETVDRLKVMILE